MYVVNSGSNNVSVFSINPATGVISGTTPSTAGRYYVTVSASDGTYRTTLSFLYNIGAGDNSADLDYSATNSLALAGGTIKDAATNNATLTLPAVGGAHRWRGGRTGRDAEVRRSVLRGCAHRLAGRT